MANSSKQQIEVSNKGGSLQKMPSLRMLRPLEEMEQLVDRLMGRSWLHPFSQLNWERHLPVGLSEALESRLPAMDVVDRDEELFVRAELPGVEKKDLDVSLSDNMLTIKGSMSREEKEEKGDYYRCEISRGTFARSVTLPCNVDASKIKAALKDGVLEITLPKAEQSKRQSIDVQ